MNENAIKYATSVSRFCLDTSRCKEYLFQGFVSEGIEFAVEVLRYDDAVRNEADPEVCEGLRKAALKEGGDLIFFALVPDRVLPEGEGLCLLNDPNTDKVWRMEVPRAMRQGLCLCLLDKLALFSSACAKEVREPESKTKRWLQRLESAADILRLTAQISRTLGSSLQEMADLNEAKLTDRFERGVIKGDGGSR